MVRFIDDESIRRFLSIDDLQIKTERKTICLRRKMHIMNNLIILDTQFPEYEANEAFNPRTDRHLYFIYLDGPIRDLRGYDMKGFDGGKALIDELRAISLSLYMQCNYKLDFCTNPDKEIQRQFINGKKVHINILDNNSVCFSDAHTNEPLVVTSKASTLCLREDGSLAVITKNSVYSVLMCNDTIR